MPVDEPVSPTELREPEPTELREADPDVGAGAARRPSGLPASAVMATPVSKGVDRTVGDGDADEEERVLDGRLAVAAL